MKFNDATSSDENCISSAGLNVADTRTNAALVVMSGVEPLGCGFGVNYLEGQIQTTRSISFRSHNTHLVKKWQLTVYNFSSHLLSVISITARCRFPFLCIDFQFQIITLRRIAVRRWIQGAKGSPCA